MPVSPAKSDATSVPDTHASDVIDDRTTNNINNDTLEADNVHQDATDELSTANSAASNLGFAIQEEEKVKIINRLRRLEGQVRGLQRMVEEERSCKEVLTLLAGVRSALNATADRILVNYLEHCQAEFTSQDTDTQELDVQDLVQAVKLARG
ncbi:MAG: metal-sensitive transcriptional regulator [Deinococcota bacterium]